MVVFVPLPVSRQLSQREVRCADRVCSLTSRVFNALALDRGTSRGHAVYCALSLFESVCVAAGNLRRLYRALALGVLNLSQFLSRG